MNELVLNWIENIPNLTNIQLLAEYHFTYSSFMLYEYHKKLEKAILEKMVK